MDHSNLWVRIFMDKNIKLMDISDSHFPYLPLFDSTGKSSYISMAGVVLELMMKACMLNHTFKKQSISTDR